MRYNELRQKEVINCRDGERLGYVCDILFNPCTACIQSLVLPGPCKLWGILGRDEEYIIPWNCIKQIGSEVILVDIELSAFLIKCT